MARFQVISSQAVVLLRLKCPCEAFCKSYTMVCSPVLGDNPRALASGLSPIQAITILYHPHKSRPRSV